MRAELQASAIQPYTNTIKRFKSLAQSMKRENRVKEIKKTQK